MKDIDVAQAAGKRPVPSAGIEHLPNLIPTLSCLGSLPGMSLAVHSTSSRPSQPSQHFHEAFLDHTSPQNSVLNTLPAYWVLSHAVLGSFFLV